MSTTDPICLAPRCDRPSPGAYLCAGEGSCTDKLRRDLTDIANGIIEELETSYLRQSHATGARGRSRGGDAPLPFDDRASGHQANAIINAITTWARLVAEEQQLISPSSVAGCGRLLLAQLGWLRQQRYAGEAYDELHRAVGHVVRVVDRPNDALTFIGRCPGDWPEGDPCTAALYAKPKAPTTSCSCGRTWKVAEIKPYLEYLARDVLATASECSRAVKQVSDTLKVTPERIWKWKQRGRLLSRGLLDGKPLYRVGDVIDRLSEDAATQARRAIKRDQQERTAS